MSTAPDKASLSGRVVAGGATSRDALAEALGIDRGPFTVDAIAWVDQALELAVDVGGDVPAVLRVESCTPESKGLVVTEHLNIYVRGRDAPERLAARVAEHAPAAMADWTLAHVAAIIASDPELGQPGLPMPPAADESERPQSLLDTWGSEESYADFFASGEIARCQLDSIDPSSLFQYVQHCDAECLQVNPSSIIPVASIVNYPWENNKREPGRPVRLGDERLDPESMVTSDLDENDVIFGNLDKLQQVLEHAVSRPNPDNKAIFFSNTCVPAVIGEDVESLVRQAEAQSGRKIFYLTVTPRSMTTVFHRVLVERRLAAERTAGVADVRAVNLIGFPDGRATDDLEALLAAAGVRVNARFLPALVPETVDLLPRAALNVLYPNRTWQHLYDQLTFDSRTPHIAPNAPYGLAGTQRWLRDILAALGLGGDSERVWQSYMAEWREPWERQHRAASEQRLGFVVRDQETYFLSTPSTTWGVPLVEVLEEAGFGLDVLMRVGDKETANESARALRRVFAEPSRHSIRAFDSFAFLRHRLRQSPSRAFLSYQFFDWRLSEAGKAVFSIQHFEMGVPGAMRTVARLVDLCRLPFFHRYARYLGRTAEGLRVEVGHD